MMMRLEVVRKSVYNLHLLTQGCLPITIPLLVTCVFPSMRPNTCVNEDVVVVFKEMILRLNSGRRSTISRFGFRVVFSLWYFEWAI